jgi:hypothetical protein
VVAAESTPAPSDEPELALGLGLEEVLLVETAESSAGRALDALLASWGYPSISSTGVDPNLFASAVRQVSPLRVFATRADQELLRVLDLPAVLEVELAPSERRYVAVVGLDADGLWQLALGERTFAVEPSGLDRIATGRTFFAWTNFESLPAMQRGMQGSAVRWLQARLAELGYLRLGDPSGQFDEPTVAAVRSFQNDLALDPTGAVGPETMIGLYQVLHYGAPRLAPGPQGEVS